MARRFYVPRSPCAPLMCRLYSQATAILVISEYAFKRVKPRLPPLLDKIVVHWNGLSFSDQAGEVVPRTASLGF